MFRFLFPVFLLLFGLGFVVEGLRHGRENSAFQSHGVATRIRSIENPQTYAVYKQKSLLFDEKKYVGAFHNGEVTFQTKAGELATVPSMSLPPGLLDAVSSGQIVTIWYLPEQPATIRFADKNEPATEEKMLGILLVILGVYYIVRATRR